MERIRTDALANAKTLPDHQPLGMSSSKYVGKELKLRDSKDPLGGKVLNSANFDE